MTTEYQINSLNDFLDVPEEEWVMFDTYVTTHLEPDGSGHAFYETEEWESEEVFDVKTMLELRAATAERLAEIDSTAYQESPMNEQKEESSTEIPVKEESLVRGFQSRVEPWLIECFGEAVANDSQERSHRFLEEALELVQATGCTEDEAVALVKYVYGRPVGEPSQEVGGAMVTLAALCQANGLDMHQAGETELARVWTKIPQIQAKQASKPAMSPLPGVYPDRQPIDSEGGHHD